MTTSIVIEGVVEEVDLAVEDQILRASPCITFTYHLTAVEHTLRTC